MTMQNRRGAANSIASNEGGKPVTLDEGTTLTLPSNVVELLNHPQFEQIVAAMTPEAATVPSLVYLPWMDAGRSSLIRRSVSARDRPLHGRVDCHANT